MASPMTDVEFLDFKMKYYGTESPFDLEVMGDLERRRSQLEKECADIEREEQERARQPILLPRKLSRQEILCVDGSTRQLELAYEWCHIPTLVVHPIQKIIKQGEKGQAMEIIMKPKLDFTLDLRQDWMQSTLRQRESVAEFHNSLIQFKSHLESLEKQRTPINVNKMVCFGQPPSLGVSDFLTSHYDNYLLVSNIAYELENQKGGQPLRMYFFCPPDIVSKSDGELRNRALMHSGKEPIWEQVGIARAFQEIDQHTIVVIVKPSIPVSQILCDISLDLLPKAILCPKVDMIRGEYPDEGIADPLSPQVQGIFATYYTTYDLGAGSCLYVKKCG